jgi:hypothetical protein
MMKKFAASACLVAMTVLATAGTSDAGWKNRGWYAKHPGANCVIRQVVIAGVSGKAVVKKVRVCR